MIWFIFERPGTARRERLRQAVAATRRRHRRLLQEMVTTPVTHALLAARLGSRRIRQGGYWN